MALSSSSDRAGRLSAADAAHGADRAAARPDPDAENLLLVAAIVVLPLIVTFIPGQRAERGIQSVDRVESARYRGDAEDGRSGTLSIDYVAAVVAGASRCRRTSAGRPSAVRLQNDGVVTRKPGRDFTHDAKAGHVMAASRDQRRAPPSQSARRSPTWRSPVH
jgi:hypothetical protein